MSVYYKFKSSLAHDTVTFDGLSISVADLRKSIMRQKKIGKASDFDLQITNAQTKEVYDNDEELIPKNTSVIVARVPVAAGRKKNWKKPDLPLPIDDDLGQIRYDRIVKNADLDKVNTSEEDKIKAMITQSSLEYDPSKYVKSRSMTGRLPPTYTCLPSYTSGHWITNCPTNNPRVKRSTGIPRSFMVAVDGPEHKGALLTSSGEYAVPLIDHQAYKEVKKDKPPFLPQEEPVVEPEAQIPEELLCRVCKDLLQDAVLMCCCGNSFCDECIRQVLLESDNHECPECQEADVSPNTLIPNRYLRTAVLNFKNQTGYTRVKKSFVKSEPVKAGSVSPQLSPDSTVESQPQQIESIAIQSDKPALVEDKVKIETPPPPEEQHEDVGMPSDVDETSQPAASHKSSLDEDAEDIQPGTPLADEPPVDAVHQPLPIQTIGQEQYHQDRCDYHSGSRYSRNYRDDSRDNYKEESMTSSEPPKPISTIATIINIHKGRGLGRPVPVRPPFVNPRPHRVDERPDSYNHDRDDYHTRYDRRHGRNLTRSRDHSRYDRSAQSRYHTNNEYHHAEEHQESHYDVKYETHVRAEETSRRHRDRHRMPSHTVPVYPVAAMPVPSIIPFATQVYPPQPPPPGTSPVDTSHVAAQPPPPGVGPLLPPAVSNDQSAFNSQHYENEDSHKDAKKIDDRSVDDKLEAFQRELKRKRRYSRDHSSHSRSQCSGRERSRSSSRSRSYSSSKSSSRSHSRSSSRSSRSRSRTPLSSRSRSRSYSHSRSRSRTKSRSYTRSCPRTRSPSSRSRSSFRTEPRFRRRVEFGERIRSPRPRSRSRSYSPKNYRHTSHRSVSYTGRHSYTPPHFGASYQYEPAPYIDIPVLQTEYPPHHVHPIHPVPQSLHSQPIEHYPIERQPRYPPPYNEMYPMYDVYPHQRYDQEQSPPHYDKRQEYQKDYQRQHPEVIALRIPGYTDDRLRDYKQRYRQPREPRKEIIRELHEPSRPDKRRPECSSQSRSVRHYDPESMQDVEKSRRVENVPRSRSRSYESIESHNSFKRKHTRQHSKHSQEPPRHKSSREHSQSEPDESKSNRKQSPIKSPEKHTSESDRVKKQWPREPRKEIIREPCEPSRPDRRRPESSSQSRSVRHYGRESMQDVENVPRSRSKSYESIESHNSFKRKHIKQHSEHSQEPPRHKSSREHSQSEPGESKSKRKHSPIKPPEKHTSESDRVKKQQRRDCHDDLKFEPDYEPYSDIEEKERMKRSASPEVVRKKARVEKIITESSEKDSKKVEKLSATSSASLSAVSESESSDFDEPKTTRNKVSDSDKQKHKKSKHKKHKYKKKSHKSRRE